MKCHFQLLRSEFQSNVVPGILTSFLTPVSKSQHFTHWNFGCVENIFMYQTPVKMSQCCHSSKSTGVNSKIIDGLVPFHFLSVSCCCGLDRLVGDVTRTVSLLMLLLTPAVFLSWHFLMSAVEKV